MTTTVPQIVVHPGRDPALARLKTPVTSSTPVEIAATAPAGGDVLTLTGLGRTAAEWVSDRGGASTGFGGVSNVAGVCCSLTGPELFNDRPPDGRSTRGAGRRFRGRVTSR